MLNNNCDPRNNSMNIVSPLHIASGNGHHEIANLLLNHNCDANSTDNNGLTPLFIASTYGHIEIVKLLLKYKGIKL